MLRNPDWKKKIKPNLEEGEKSLRGFLKVFSVMLLLFITAVIGTSFYNHQYIITGIGVVSFYLVLVSWLKLCPSIYNRVHKSKKIVPIGESIDRNHVVQEICKTETPYGQPLMGFYGNFILNVPAYLLKDEGWVVFFYIRNSDFILGCKKTKENYQTLKNRMDDKLLLAFQKDLVKMFNFIINTNRQPSRNELDFIFENYNKLAKTIGK